MHEELENFAVIGSELVNQFMHDYELSQVLRHGQEKRVKR